MAAATAGRGPADAEHMAPRELRRSDNPRLRTRSRKEAWAKCSGMALAEVEAVTIRAAMEAPRPRPSGPSETCAEDEPADVDPFTISLVRILDTTELDLSLSRALASITLYLTPDEAGRLASDLEQLAEDPVGLHHAHLEETEDIGVNPEGITLGRGVRQITVAVYVDENLDQFDERSRR